MKRGSAIFQRCFTGCRGVLALALLGLAGASVFGTSAGGSSRAGELQGQDLYAIHCARCHTQRYPTEFTAKQWQVVMMHMRVRANLPASQADQVLKYLQEDSGN